MERESDVTVKVTRNLFRLDGMVERILGKARTAMESRERDRGPDPDTADEERILVPVRYLESLTRSQGPGPGSINGMRSKLVDAVIWIILAISAWNLKATIDNSRDIAVLQCQSNPSCLPTVTRGNP